jgi:hypothetical protein
MDTHLILGELRAERDRINQAIAALESLDGTGRTAPAVRPVARHAQKATKRHLSPSARKRISELLKQRWAARKRQGKTKL